MKSATLLLTMAMVFIGSAQAAPISAKEVNKIALQQYQQQRDTFLAEHKEQYNACLEGISKALVKRLPDPYTRKNKQVGIDFYNNQCKGLWKGDATKIAEEMLRESFTQAGFEVLSASASSIALAW